MCAQLKSNSYTKLQSVILDLEKKYFDFIDLLITSPKFIKDLENIENNIQSNYSYLANTWNLKNKLKIPAERLLRYHIIKNDIVRGFYPSPISCDLAVEVDDAIINIDIKTIDVIGNSGDITTIQFEHNQTSFKNKKVLENGKFEGFEIKSNLPTIDPITKKPLLTYLVKIIYSDNGQSFSIFKNTGYPLMTLTCLPNGELSSLFNNNLFYNIKNYNYFKTTDGPYYTPKKICSKTSYDTLTSDKEKYEIMINNCCIPKTWYKVKIVDKLGFYDDYEKTLWVPVLRGSKHSNKIYELNAVKSPHTCRFDHTRLIERYTSNNSYWNGIKSYELTIEHKGICK